MNIGFVSTWFERGAAYVTNSYLQILKQNHKVYVYARGGEKYAKNDPKWDKEYVTWGKRIDFRTNIHFRDFKKWIKKNKLDIIFFNEQNEFIPVYKTKKLFPEIKLGAYVDYYKINTVKNFAIYDFIICNTKKHYEVFSWHKNSYYIPWGTDIDLFKPQKNENSEITFFHSQGMSGRKGTDILINTFIEKELYKKSKLIIHSQNNLKKVENIKYKNLENYNIKIINKTVPAPGLYHLGDVYVYPTTLEGIGLTILEALSSGLPVITTDNGPMNEFVKEGINGKLIKIEKFISRDDGYYWPMSIPEKESLAESMNYYIENKNKIDTYKEKAREYAEKNLDWQKNKKQIVKIFENYKNYNPETKNIEEEIKRLKKENKKELIDVLFKYLVPNIIKKPIINYVYK